MVAERPAKVAPQQRVEEVDGNNPFVRDLREAYLAKFGLRRDAQSNGTNWFAVYEGDAVALVFAVGIEPGGGIVGTDFYAAPSRAGVRAVYSVLTFFKALIDEKALPYGAVQVLASNRTMRRRVEAVFGLTGPTAITYSYEGETQHGG